MKLPSLGVGTLPILSFSLLFLGKPTTSSPVSIEVLNEYYSGNETFHTGNDLVRRDRIDDTTLTRAKQDYPRIDWDFAADDCTSEQFKVLYETTTSALDMMHSSGEWKDDVWWSPGFNRFFVRNDEWRRDNINWSIYAADKWKLVQQFPKSKPESERRKHKLRYVCKPKEAGWLNCDKPQVPAFTVLYGKGKEVNNGNPCPICEMMGFCPMFFGSLDPLKKVMAKGPQPESAIASLATREHALIHEWFHNFMIDVAQYRVVDVKGDIPGYGTGVAVYGAQRCAAFAWRDMKTTGKVNGKTLLNADSFAWMVSYNWFAANWQWKGDGKPAKRDMLAIERGHDMDKRQDGAQPEYEDAVDVEIPVLPNVPDGWCVEGDAGCNCPGCDLSDTGGCWLSQECRYPDDNGLVSKDCTCKCDLTKGDGNTATTVFPITDPVCWGWDGAEDRTGNGAAPGSGGQQVGIAAYIPPTGDPDAWTRMTNAPNDKLNVLVANALNGPDNSVNTNWQKVINNAAAAGKTVIGYVRTGYLGQSNLGFTTRLGSNELADWVSQIESDVDLWYSLYPNKIRGIFFDEGWNDCGPDNKFSELYRLISENTKRKYPGALTVLNPGATMPKCFEDSADTLMTFESSYESYTSNYVSNGWTPASTTKIWHIIYNVPQGEIANVAALAKQRGAGYVQITDDTLPNPYDTLPNAAYMNTLLGAMEGGTPRVALPRTYESGAAAGAPSGLTVTATDYSSVSLKWSAAANAKAYQVYVNGEAKLRLASYMTSVTVGDLKVGTSGFSFQVSSIGGGGAESTRSDAVSASTKSPPQVGKYITNAKVSASAGSTKYEADVLIPYAYVRLYITHTVNGLCSEGAWTINYSSGYYVCAVYMVESGTLYKYNGPKFDGVNAPTWSWTSLGAADVKQDHYHFTWNIPIGTSTLPTTNFLIQTEGYGPLLNYMQPCPTFADSSTYCSG